MKQQLKGKQFLGVKSAPAFFEGVISHMPRSTWPCAMVKWFERMARCVPAEVEGEGEGGGGDKLKNWTTQMRPHLRMQKLMG